MYKPIINNEIFNYQNLIIFLKSNFVKLIKFPILAVVIVIIYFIFFKTPTYSSKISFYTNYKKAGESSLLTPFLGAMNGDESLNFSIDNYIVSDKLLEEISLKKYDINGESQSLVDFWSQDYNKIFSINPLKFVQNINNQYMLNKNLNIQERKLSFTKKKLGNSILHKEERLSNLHTIYVTVRRDAFLSQQIADAIYNSTIAYSNEITNTKAIENRNFINDRVNQVRNDLENFEDEMILFLNNNQSLNSPSLLVQRGRIQRNINLHTQLLANLSDQLEISKIDAQDSTSSIFLLDKSAVSYSKAGIAPLRAVILIFFIMFIASISLELYRNRDELFVLNHR